MLAVLYEDDEIFVVDKPAGLAAQPGEGVGVSVLSLIEEDFHFKPYPVHRLDKETAGCMIIAKDSVAASRWSALVASRKIRKLYWAVCSGTPEADLGSFDDPLTINKRKVTARTEYRCLGRYFSAEGTAENYGASERCGAACKGGAEAGIPAERFSLLELELDSGRMHQIRRHLAMHNLPILGDDKYGDFTLNRRLRKQKALRHLLLWARCLELSDGTMIQAAIPKHFALFLADWPEIQITLEGLRGKNGT